MTEQKPRVPRTTLWSHGRKGDADRMRVLVDKKQGRVEVHYKDGAGETKKEIFSPDNRENRAKAIAWAETFRDERQRIGRAKQETTHAELWAAYQKSPAWDRLRKKSRPSYEWRWNRWVKFRGARTKPDDTTLHHIDQFIMAMKAQGVAEYQVHLALNLVRVIYNWGQQRELLTRNVFIGWRWQTAKAKPDETNPAETAAGTEDEDAGPGEYTQAEYDAILAELAPQNSRRWRANVMLLLAGYHGQRGHALTHLRLADIDFVRGRITWPAAWQKNGKALVQPLTYEGYAAVMTALAWRDQLGYTGPWLLPGGSEKKRGIARELREWEKDPKHKKVGTWKGKPRAVVDEPYSYSAAHGALIAAEDRAGVTHQPGRAFHGFRKMAAGNVYDATGDMGLAMGWIGDRIDQAPRYLKKREERLDRAADAVQTGGKKNG